MRGGGGGTCFFFAVWAGGVLFFFDVWAGDGSSLTYRSAWLVFKQPNNKKKTKQQKTNTGSPSNPIKRRVPFCLMFSFNREGKRVLLGYVESCTPEPKP